MQEERDIVLFSDDDGNDFELEVIDYFFHDGQEYAVLIDAAVGDEELEHEHEHGEDCDCDMQEDVYIMKVMQVGEDMEEFVPVEDELMEQLVEIVNGRFADDEDLDDGDDEE